MRPESRDIRAARAVTSPPCPAICGIEKGEGRTKRPFAGRQGKHAMDNSEKDRLAKAVVDLWIFFQEALGATKREYPTREFLSFVEATRSYIDLTRDDQLIHREVARAINGLTEFSPTGEKTRARQNP